jgi:hypothetical protein
MLNGVISLFVLLALFAIYAMVGAKIGDKVIEYAPYWVALTAAIIGPAIVLGVIFFLGEFFTGIMLSGRF